MITKILCRKQFNELLIKEGWMVAFNDLFLVCPFDPDMRVSKSNGTFFKGMYNGPDEEVVIKITNIKNGSWEYDDTTGLISNGFAALRVK